ncbi:MAG: sirohydrochlorin cobaltochelatase [Desulfovibrionaceae bacterium]|nr:sirohydrochlorin cobaltochelatase [Desulfovibrionaceae bacterium]
MKNAILLVAYGAATLQGRRVLVSIDKRVRESFPGFAVRWAYSSEIVRKRLIKSRLKSDSVLKALQRLIFEHFTGIVLQPLQTIPGKEHEDIKQDMHKVGLEQPHLQLYLGNPLLSSFRDIARVAKSLLQYLPIDRKPFEDVIFMGHGSKHPASFWYTALHADVQALDKFVHVGTMEGQINLNYLLPRLTSERVWLMPLLSTVGRHTLQDMAGSSHSSWRSCLEASGHLCFPVLKGTAEHSAIVDIWLDHLRQAAWPLL